MPTTDTVVGRLELVHPDLGHDGGSGLHTKVRNAWTKIADNMNARFFEAENLADAASVDLDHNFLADFEELTILLYTFDGSGNLTRINATSTPSITDFTVAASPSNPPTTEPNTHVRITNNSGSEQDVAIVIIHSGGASSGGGGGGGGLLWLPSTLLSAPQEGEVNGFRYHEFSYQDDSDQHSVVGFHVPDSYTPGSQIKLRLAFSSPSSSNGFKFQTTSTLIRSSDAITSTTNQHTNAQEFTNTLANGYHEAEFDLTESDGQVNGVDVSPNDWLALDLTRLTNDANDDDSTAVKFLWSLTQPVFG